MWSFLAFYTHCTITNWPVAARSVRLTMANRIPDGENVWFLSENFNIVIGRTVSFTVSTLNEWLKHHK